MRPGLGLLFLVGVLTAAGLGIHHSVKVGEKTKEGVVVTSFQSISPEGKTSVLRGRAMDVAWLPSGKLLLKTTGGLVLLDPEKGDVLQTLQATGGSSMTGLLLNQKGDQAYFSNAGNQALLAQEGNDGKWSWGKGQTFPAPGSGGQPHPTGLAWIVPGKTLAVCLSRSNAVAVVDVSGGTPPRLIPVDICPYGVALAPDGSLLVTCWSRQPQAGEETQTSSGTAVPVTPGGVAKSGVLLKVDPASGKVVERVPVGLQPTEVAVRNGKAYVAAANSDQLIEASLSPLKVARQLRLSPVPKLPLGSSPNALALSQDGKTLYAACGGINAVAVVDTASFKTQGWIPTGWFPGGLAVRGGRLAVVGIKGEGSRAEPDPLKRDAYDWTTTVSVLPEPKGKALAQMTQKTLGQLKAGTMLAAAAPSRRSVKPVPVPARLGEPSVFRHVVFILKENRTYDQVFGDMKEGDGEPSLCLFPRPITPNHHALADRFGLLDNYYCNGILSADGHAWATEGQTTAYFERSFGGWTRSYPFGDDPLAVSSSGYLWEDMVEKGISFRNFGEFDYAEPANKETFKQVYDDFISGERKIKFTHKIGVAQLRKHSAPNYPGWNMGIPDVLRAEEFLKEFRQMEAKGDMPRFTIIYLPQDHHSGDEPGMPTPRAHLADNDLALGQVMEALMKSRFWSKMAVFCNEDDPGGGLDHVDGHRSICLVMSPYSRPGVNSRFYNQSSVLATMRRILGLGPLTQADARAPLMFDCFQPQPRTVTFRALTPSVPLDELNKSRALAGVLDLSGPDRADENLRNRKLWAVSRPGIPYPERFGGAHGAGLKAKGLRLDTNVVEDDEDDD